MPSDAKLEKCLRDIVVAEFKAQRHGEVTVNNIRKACEARLGLNEGFFADSDKWKSESKKIIRDEVDKQESAGSPEKPKPKEAMPRAKKRSSPVPSTTANKRRKISDDQDAQSSLSSVLSDSQSVESEPEPERPTTKQSKAQKKEAKTIPLKKAAAASKKAGNGTSLKKRPTDAKDDGNDDKPSAAKVPVQRVDQSEDSGSELSVLIDDEPKPKKQRKTKDPSDTKSKPKTKASKAKAEQEEDPDTAQIKCLQGWLVKCGIRKLWGKELKPYVTPKDKIKHLRDMLSKAGMTGRYSTEKATQIKEARELAADIEAVQEGDERWGKGNGNGEDSEQAMGGRRLIRGSKHYDFLSSDGEETD